MIGDKLEADLKAALLAGDKTKTGTLRVLKSALQYEAVALGVQAKGLDDEQAQKVLAREVKKRTEAAELYQKAGESDRAAAELDEKKIIEAYLPPQVDESAITEAVRVEVAKLDSPTPADMGKVIGAVRGKFGAGADGSVIARIAKQQLGA